MAFFIAALLPMLIGCENGIHSQNMPEVVLYSSVDDLLLRQITDQFEADTGIRVRIVGDNEANKTTGLMQRILLEMNAPRADVWWSSEPFSTIRLEREGALEPCESGSAESVFANGWPEHLKGKTWYGFAQRCRVIAWSTTRVDTPPRSIVELTGPRWKGRVGMARPEFGTTRGHMGILVQQWGAAKLESWLVSMKKNGLRLYDGNASVVRAIRTGEIDVGLTDTDDVWAARRNGWEIDAVFEQPDIEVDGLISTGPILLPNTVAIVRNGPNPDQAARLVDYLLDESTERLIAQSESRNLPVHPSVQEQFPDLVVDGAAEIDLTDAEEHIPEAMEICQRVLR